MSSPPATTGGACGTGCSARRDTLRPVWTYEIFLAHVFPEDRAGVDRSFRAAMAAQANWNFECRILRADGQELWFNSDRGQPGVPDIFRAAGSGATFAAPVSVTELNTAYKDFHPTLSSDALTTAAPRTANGSRGATLLPAAALPPVAQRRLCMRGWATE